MAGKALIEVAETELGPLWLKNVSFIRHCLKPFANWPLTRNRTEKMEIKFIIQLITILWSIIWKNLAHSVEKWLEDQKWLCICNSNTTLINQKRNWSVSIVVKVSEHQAVYETTKILILEKDLTCAKTVENVLQILEAFQIIWECVQRPKYCHWWLHTKLVRPITAHCSKYVQLPCYKIGF